MTAYQLAVLCNSLRGSQKKWWNSFLLDRDAEDDMRALTQELQGAVAEDIEIEGPTDEEFAADAHSWYIAMRQWGRTRKREDLESLRRIEERIEAHVKSRLF